MTTGEEGMQHAGETTAAGTLDCCPDDAKAAQRALWETHQEQMSKQVVEDDFYPAPWNVGTGQSATAQPPDPSPCSRPALRFLGGVDLSFVGDESDMALASLVVLSLPALDVVHESYLWTKVTLPYISGFLAFREVGPLLTLVNQLCTEHPDLRPDVILVDGSGVLHPRGCGLASHLGLLTGIPTIGVAKTFLHLDGLTTTEVKARMAAELADGSGSDGYVVKLTGESGRVWGAAFVPAGGVVRNPIFVSVGTGLSLDTAVHIVKACCRHRVPEPIRQADIRSRAFIRERLSGIGSRDSMSDTSRVSTYDGQVDAPL